MSAPGKLVRSSRWKTGPSKGQRPLGSECCVATGDSGCEAYTAIAWGVGLSHERSYIAGAKSFYSLEGNMCGTAMRGADALPGSKATSRAKGSHRKLGDLGSDRNGIAAAGPHREGEEPQPMMNGPEKSDSVIVAGKPTNKAERSAAELGERRAGTKGNAGQSTTRWTQSRISVTQGVGSHTATYCRRPEVGAVCGKAARTDLCGGRSVMSVPTAKLLLRCTSSLVGTFR